MDSETRRWWSARVPGAINGLLVGAFFGVWMGLAWVYDWVLSARGSQTTHWPYPDITLLSRGMIWLTCLTHGLALTAIGLVFGFLSNPPQVVVTRYLSVIPALWHKVAALCRRALAAIRYVTRPRITFLD